MGEKLLSVEIKLLHIPEYDLDEVLDNLSDYLEEQEVRADVGVVHEAED